MKSLPHEANTHCLDEKNWSIHAFSFFLICLALDFFRTRNSVAFHRVRVPRKEEKNPQTWIGAGDMAFKILCIIMAK